MTTMLSAQNTTGTVLTPWVKEVHPSVQYNEAYIVAQLLVLGALSATALSEAKQAYKRSRGGLVFLNGAFVRVWFLSLIGIGLVLRTLVTGWVCWWVVESDRMPVPFMAALGHCVPSLVLLSAYSMAAVFLAEVCCRSRSNDLPFLTPFLVGTNALMYILFFVVTSITHLRHAHREFRMTAFGLLGLSHITLAAIWCYFGVKLVLRLHGRSMSSVGSQLRGDGFTTRFHDVESSGTFRTTSDRSDLCSPDYVTPPSRPSSHETGTNSHSISIDVTTQPLHNLMTRMLILTLFCPPLFAMNGIVDIILSYQLWRSNQDRTPSPPAEYYAIPSRVNVALFLTEALPALAVVLTSCPAETLRWLRVNFSGKTYWGHSPEPRRDPRQVLRAFFGDEGARLDLTTQLLLTAD